MKSFSRKGIKRGEKMKEEEEQKKHPEKINFKYTSI